MWANEPEMAEKWEDEEEKNEGRRMRVTEHQLRRIIREALEAEMEEEVLAEEDLEEYWNPGIDTSGRVDTSRADKKPTGEEMGCKDRRTGKTVKPYWQQRMGKWVCP